MFYILRDVHAKIKTCCGTTGRKGLVQYEFKIKLLGSYDGVFLLQKKQSQDVYRFLWPNEVSHPPMEDFQKGPKEYSRCDHPIEKDDF
jgi:hypothetical protein